MRFRLYRKIRGGRLFPNGTFETLAKALEAKKNLVDWHKANGTSSVAVLEDEEGKVVDEHYQAPDEQDVNEDLPPPEEDPELRIKQLEEELAKERAKNVKAATKKGKKGAGVAIEQEEGEEEAV